MAASVRYGGASDGWVVSGKRLVEDSEGNVATGALNAFNNSANYSADSFDVSSETTTAQGVVHDGSSYWVLSLAQTSGATATVYEYDSSGVYQSNNFSVSDIDYNLNDGGGYDITHDGTNFWISDPDDNTILEVDSAGTVQSTETFGSLLPTGITWTGSKFIIAVQDGTSWELHRYDPSWSKEAEATHDFVRPEGIGWDGSNIWVCDVDSGTPSTNVEEYATDLSETGRSFSADNTDGNTPSITHDDTSFRTIGWTTDSAYEYNPATLSHSIAAEIDTGEALVGGAHLATDDTHGVELADSTNNQTVYVGWKDSAADTVIVDTDSGFTSDDPQIEIWEFDTDSTSVTASRDLRNTERTITPTRSDPDRDTSGNSTSSNRRIQT